MAHQKPFIQGEPIECPNCGGQIMMTYFISGMQYQPIKHLGYDDEYFYVDVDWDNTQEDLTESEHDETYCNHCGDKFNFGADMWEEMDDNDPLIWTADCPDSTDAQPCGTKTQHVWSVARRMANGQPKEVQ